MFCKYCGKEIKQITDLTDPRILYVHRSGAISCRNAKGNIYEHYLNKEQAAPIDKEDNIAKLLKIIDNV